MSDPISPAVGRGVLHLFCKPTPLLDGHALQALGLKPGPAFRRILDAVYDAQLEGRVDSPQGARELALQIAGQA